MSSWFVAGGALAEVKQATDDLGVSVYVVGGCVRDRLLGRESHDMDFAVDGPGMTLARQVANRIKGAYFALDEERDAARVVRKEGVAVYYLDFARLRGDDLEADLKLRDFTVNAIATPLEEWELDSPAWVDPTGGCRDLEEGLLRAASPSAFVDDPVRTLRAVRLAGSLGLRCDTQTETLIRRDAPLLADASGERVRDELSQMMVWPGAYARLLDLDRLGLLSVILPELIPMKGVEQGPWHRFDVYEHSLRSVQALEALGDPRTMIDLVRRKGIGEQWEAVRAPFAAEIQAHLGQELSGGRPRRVLLCLAALLHDVAKPELRVADENGDWRFHGHDKAGAPIVGSILRRLHFSSGEVREGQVMVRQHMRPGFLTKEGKVTRRAAYRFFRDTGYVAVSVLLLSLADYLATKGSSIEMEPWKEHLSTIGRLLRLYYREPDLVDPPRLVTGDDLMAELGIPPGPRVGELLEAIREAEAVGEVRSPEEALALAQRLLRDEGGATS